MLGRHQDLAWFSQYSPHIRRRGIKKLVPNNRHVDQTLRKILPVPWNKKLSLLEKFAPTPIDMDVLWDWIPEHQVFLDQNDFTADHAKRLTDLIADEQSFSNKPRFLLKRPEFTRIVLLLSKIFPKAKFVHIVRDGKAVAGSIAPKFARSPFGAAPSLMEASRFWQDALNYVDHCNDVLPNQILTIRYEDMCKDVPKHLRTILDFSELSHEKFDFSSVPQSLTSTNDKWLNAYSDAEKIALNEHLGKTLGRYGYDLFPV
jgi:hypothetical protein